MFENYKSFCEDLKFLLGLDELTQWIDGSYVTLIDNPKDIDVVTFIDSKLIKVHENGLKDFICPISKNLRNRRLCHCCL